MRTAIITGASSGLGLECARALLRSDPSWHVVLPVRDAGRGAEAVRQLGEPQRCTVMPMDLASLASVRAFVDKVRAAGLPPVHAIERIDQLRKPVARVRKDPERGARCGRVPGV